MNRLGAKEIIETVSTLFSVAKISKCVYKDRESCCEA